MKEMFATKENKIRVACFLGGALLLFFVIPALLNLLPEETGAAWKLLLWMIFNQIYIGICGWQSNHLGKLGIYVPAVLIVIFMLSEYVFYGNISWALEANYVQTAYICYFLKKFITIRQKQQEAREKKAFPKGVGRK